ncbi:MAG: putative metal-binding motif-containing protein [Deltaproteobacteria bacterium]|nr:putative metal-binding motif-containing protein [Deltaproteobacteria bacterium]
MLLLLLVACPPPVLPDTGAIPRETGIDSADTDTGGDDTGDTASDTGDTGAQIDDADGDGYLPDDTDAARRDCDDNDPEAYPAAPERFSYADEDCDGNLIERVDDIDESVSVSPLGLVWSLETVPDPVGTTRVAAGLINDNQVAITPAEDFSDGVLGDDGQSTLVTSPGGGTFGYALVGCELDGDGVTDLLIGDPGSTGTDDTAFYLAFGSDLAPGTMSTSSLAKIVDSSLLSRVGFAATPLGEDLAITGIEGGGTSVWLLDGQGLVDGSITELSQGARIESTATTLGLGITLAGLEVDNDDGGDLVAGAPMATTGTRVTAGGLFVFGGSSISTSEGDSISVDDADIMIFGDNAGDNFGGFIVGAADLDGDGQADFIVSDYRDDGERTWHVVLGGIGAGIYDIGDVARTAITGTRAYVSDDGQATPRSAGIFRLDEDPRAEFIVGSPGETTGHLYVFSSDQLVGGGTLGVDEAATGLEGPGSGDYFGLSLAGADADGDLDDDLVVTAPGYESGTAWLVPSEF